jgi:CheY-like chemotaxis protein
VTQYETAIQLPRCVYVIDDNADLRKSLHFLLSVSSITAWPFATAADFIEQLPELVPGPILLDVRMPQIDGLTLLQRIRAEGLDTPAVILTMSDSETDLSAALRAGVRGYLLKDMEPEDVIAADEFEYWSDLDPEKIPWVNRSDEPVLFACPTTDESLYPPFTFSDCASFLVLVAPDEWTGDGDVDLFTTTLFGGEFAQDVLYAITSDDGDGLLCTNWFGKEVNLSVSRFVAIPDPKN